ncbi:MAG TPA: DUF3562 domain-containing protein [Steroidobacteraceae bacterium]|nr:DUF3562 domain-containing protein [Steroidobacteraceae bacterium]
MSDENPPARFEAKVDRALVRSLAREYGQPEPKVERILREELARIAAGARINTFVTVLAASSVRLRLREEGALRHH